MSYCLEEQRSWITKGLLRSSWLYICEGALFLALLAKITVTLPFTPVPITFQTLGIYCLGIMTSPTRAIGSILVYFIWGLVAPVFCNSCFGITSFFGPTAGYLYVFPLAAACISVLWNRYGKSQLHLAFILCIGASMILLGGALGLTCYLYFVGATPVIDILQGWKLGILPFIPGEILKILLVIQGRYAIAFFKKAR